MKRLLSAVVSLAFLPPILSAAELQEVASFPNQQVTGVAVSKTGRVFVNFPNWSDEHTISVAEIVAGKPEPFPNAEWNKKGGAPGTTFVCVQSVVADAEGNLWILDPAAPKMKEIVPGGPKLVKVDLKTNQVVQTIPFGKDVAVEKSYLNDVRIDLRTQTAYLTDSGKGAIIVVNLQTGKARRLLDGHKSTAAEEVKLTVQGHPVLQNGKTPPIASDGIAYDAASDFLYYHALTGHTLYRIKAEFLRDEKLSESALEAKVENLGATPAPDGMIEGPDGSVYLTAIEEDAIVRWDPTKKTVARIIQDKRLSWPDTLSWGPDGALYVTASQIQNMPQFNDGKSKQVEPYRLFKVVGLKSAPAN